MDFWGLNKMTRMGKTFWEKEKKKSYGNTAQFPPSGLSTASAAAAPRSPYRHLELCGIA